MARGPFTFKQRDITQALKAAKAVGIKVTRYEIDRQGKIAVFAANDDPAFASPTGNQNEWDD